MTEAVCRQQLEYLEIYFINIYKYPAIVNKKSKTVMVNGTLHKLSDLFLQDIISSGYDGYLDEIETIHLRRKELYYRTWKYAILHGRLPSEDDNVILYTYLVEDPDKKKLATLPYYTTTCLEFLSSKNIRYLGVISRVEAGTPLRGNEPTTFSIIKFEYFNGKLTPHMENRVKKIFGSREI